jgi:ABC-type polysaccharide/polyol phosphate export permease
MTTASQIQSYRSSLDAGALNLIRSGFREIWSHRRLTRYLVQAELHKHGADTVLGNVWWVLDPLLQMAVYVVLVSIIFKHNQPDYPLFIFAAILPWKWFSTAVNDSIGSVTSRDKIIKQVNFPKIVLPVASTVSGIVNFTFGMIPLFAMILLFYRDRLSVLILLIPVIAVVQFVFTLACGVIVAAVNVFFRDIANVARHVLRLWFYLSPALYAISDVASGHRWLSDIYALNPWTTLFESYRNVIYNDTMPQWGGLLVVLVISFVLLCFTTLFFKRLEPSFAKVL